MNKFLTIVLFTIILFSCNKNPEIDNKTMLDGTFVQDSVLTHPKKFLLSAQMDSLHDSLKNVPVIICAHGYSASSVEWKEFKSFAEKKSNSLVSLISLGGHGRNYDAFRKASWEDWQKAIIEEYEKLSALGFSNINIVGSSTGGTLVLEMLASGKLNRSAALNKVILVDPFLVSGNKALKYVKILQLFIPYVETGVTPDEVGSWYNYRPAKSLVQLQEILLQTNNLLKNECTLPDNAEIVLFKAKSDDVADFKAVEIIKNAIPKPKLTVFEIESDKHVFTRLIYREDVTPKDFENQFYAFTEILKSISD